MRNLGIIKFSGIVLLLLAGQAFAAEGTIEEIVVSADKRGATNIQDVPFSVTAYDQEDLNARLINDAMALQFNVPNMITSKYNFSGGGNVRLRGIGSGAVGSAGDDGVGVHINGTYLNASRIFETQYYDVEAVEVLRGPQGTLYGRNTTGGAVNMITAKASTESLAGNLRVTGGNYGAAEAQGMINVPLSDDFAIRIAGHYLNRDGYITNEFNGQDIDDRDMYSARLSLTWTPTDRTTIHLMAQHFDENDSRVRSQKQACNSDPSGVLGCLPTGPLSYGVASDAATITGELMNTISGILNGVYGTYAALGVPVAPPGGFPLDNFANSSNPQDPRVNNLDWSPVYKAKETTITLEISHDFGDYTLISSTGFHNPEIYSEEDYEKSVASETWAAQLAALAGLSQIPAVSAALIPTLNAVGAGGLIPFMVEAAPGLGIGAWAGNPALAQYAGGVGLLMPDNSIQRFTNFIGYDVSTSNPKQWTQELRLVSDLDGDFNFMLGGFYLSYETETHYVVRNTALTLIGEILPANPALFPAPQGDPNDPQSRSNPYMKGYDNDTREYNLETFAFFGEAYFNLNENLTATLGLRYTDEKKDAVQRTCYVTFLSCGALDPTGNFGFFEPSYSDNELTWKANITYDMNEDVMLYATVSSSYKSGGFNPISNSDPLVIADPTNAFFLPEEVLAYEVGFKSMLMDNTMQLNGTFFYYDYQDMQQSKIVGVTSLNKNTDAEIFGAELDMIWVPMDNLQITVTASWLDSSLDNFSDYDTADPNGDGSTGGLVSTNSNLTLASNGLPGVLQSLDGNELVQSPGLSTNIGVSYTIPMGGVGLTIGTNYYYQDSMWARNFNAPHDKIPSWDVWNASARVTPAAGNWYAEAWVKNITNDDHVVSQYLSTQVSGLFRNQFLLDPQTYGITLGFNW